MITLKIEEESVEIEHSILGDTIKFRLRGQPILITLDLLRDTLEIEEA